MFQKIQKQKYHVFGVKRMKLYRLEQGSVSEISRVDKAVAIRLFSGIGLFETTKILMGKPVFVKEHLERLYLSAKRIWNVEIDTDQIERGAYDVSAGHSLGMLRIFLVVGEDAKDLHIFFLVDKFPYDSTDGLKIKILDFERNPHSFVAGLKPLSYFENVVLREKLKKEGFDEGIFTYNGFIAEGTRTNIFWVKHETVFTSPLNFGILNGITRQKVIQICQSRGIPCQEISLRAEELFEQDEIFLTSSLLGVASVKLLSFREMTLSFTPKNGITQLIKKELERLELLNVSD